MVQQVERLLAQLTLEDKISLVSGQLAVDDDGNIPALPDGLPLLALADGPGGIRVANPTFPDHRATALPAPIALAATWDPDLARRYGDILGAEAAATGHNFLLGPAMDIARAPLGGRTFESFGEDPLLHARMVVPEIEAIQAHSVMACAKHYVANNQEYQRMRIDVRVDERTLQEIYLPPFAAAVREGRVAAVMGAYNRVNGTYICENRFLLTDILRGQLGFRGFVISDFMANQSTAQSANAGLDWELGAKMWGPKLLAAVQAGEVAVETIDEMARRILRPVLGLGLADHPIQRRPLPIDKHGAEALAIAEQGIVLLKNEGNLLPLDGAALRAIAVIGPEADNVSAAGGGSGCVQPTYALSVLEGIRRRAGAAVRVDFAAGVDPIGPGALLPGLPAIPSAFFRPAGAGHEGPGLRVEYWATPDFAGEPQLVRVEPRAELNFGFFDLLPGLGVSSPRMLSRPAGLAGRFSARWTGHLVVPASGDYTLSLTSLGTARLYLDGQLLIDTTAAIEVTASLPATEGPFFGGAASVAQVNSATVNLTAGQTPALLIEYAADAPGRWIFGEAMLQLGWQPPASVVRPLMAEAAALAGQADAAVVVVRTYESEEMDRPSLRLPNEQDELIRAVAAANPRTTVVLMNAGPVEVASWEEGVPTVLEAWYAGQEQGTAVAHVLFGDVNPAGKLPLTFPRDEMQTPLATAVQYPGVDGIVQYAEGVYMGYRGYDRLGIEPQYPFGHGLSYTTFEYADLRMTPESSDGTQAIQVRFELTNTGSQAGVEVAQVYVGLPEAAMAPPKRLVGWARVRLEPGERRQVTVTLDPQSSERPLSFWHTGTRRWATPEGEFRVYAGSSSRDIRLNGSFRVLQLDQLPSADNSLSPGQ